jgi:hypothetical protein
MMKPALDSRPVSTSVVGTQQMNYISNPESLRQLPPLPPGWEMKFTPPPENRAYFVDHINKKTQWHFPQK